MNELTSVDPDTGRVLRRGIRRVTVRWEGAAMEIDQPAWWPDDGPDDEAILTGDDVEIREAAFRELKRRAKTGIDRLSGAAE